jgi:hypothetical protein
VGTTSKKDGGRGMALYELQLHMFVCRFIVFIVLDNVAMQHLKNERKNIKCGKLT